MENSATPAAPKKRLTRPLWIALLMLGFAGQLAWAVENQFFNTFLYNEITPDPRPISWMVAITALVATLTAILMGALSDRMRTRWGRRKPFLVIGYIAWGIITALFPTSANFGTVSAGVFMAILLDSLMTFFGSSANDAAFNAYVADVTTVENRGKVTGALEIMKWVAILIVYGGAGIVIDLVGYPVFFYIIGGMVLLVGLVTAPLIKEEMPEEKPQGSYLAADWSVPSRSGTCARTGISSLCCPLWPYLGWDRMYSSPTCWSIWNITSIWRLSNIRFWWVLRS